MVIGTVFSQFLSRHSSTSTARSTDIPYLNTNILTDKQTMISSNVQSNRKKQLMKWYEVHGSVLTGLINMVVRDFNEEVYFEPVIGTDKGRNKIKKAKDFYDFNRMRTLFHTNCVDLLMTGEGYCYLNKLTNPVLKQLIDKSLESKGLAVTDQNRALFIKANHIDEDDLRIRNILPVASSTIENIHDSYEIIRYVQKVGASEKLFSRDDIIHLKLMDVNGRPDGFTPVFTLITQLQLDRFMWQNMLSISENSGQADKLYSVEDIDINSPSYKRIEQTLKKYHAVKNRHGSMLLNGKITVTDLTQLDSMQFETLGVYIAGLIALHWSIPRSRIPFMSKQANVKEDTGGNSEKGYYDNIEYFQDIFSGYYNEMLWKPYFKVNMRFKKSYKQDEMRETQNKQLRLDNLRVIEEQLQKNLKRLTTEFKLRYYNGVNEEITDDDLEEVNPEELLPAGTSSMNNQVSSSDVNSTPSKDKLSSRRKLEQDSSAVSKGKPTGYGKGQDDSLPLKTKDTVTTDVV